MKILVVDDERDVESLFRQRFRKELRSGVVEFVFAFSGEEALGILNKDDQTEIVLILSDINMPGMSGLDLLGRLRSEQKPYRVFMVTAYGDEATKEKALNLGADDFLSKPVDFEELRKRIGVTGP